MKKALLLFALLAGASVGLAAAGPSWIATQSRVRVMCAFTTGGSFETKTTALRGSLTASASHPSYDGSLIVDLRRLDSGSEIRNDHMRYYYLEVDKLQGYDTATLSDIDLRGLSPAAPGKGMFTASLMLHGITKSVSGDVDIRALATPGRLQVTPSLAALGTSVIESFRARLGEQFRDLHVRSGPHF